MITCFDASHPIQHAPSLFCGTKRGAKWPDFENASRRCSSKGDATGNAPDGGGLYLMVQKGGGKSWVYRCMPRGRAREMGLGPARTISLSKARARRLKFNGVDPIEQRQLARTRSTMEAVEGFTFKQAASA